MKKTVKKQKISFNTRLHRSVLTMVLLTALLCSFGVLWTNTTAQIRLIETNLRSLLLNFAENQRVAEVLEANELDQVHRHELESIIERAETVDGITIFHQDGTVLYSTDSEFYVSASHDHLHFDTLLPDEMIMYNNFRVNGIRYRCLISEVRNIKEQVVGYVEIHSLYSRQYATVLNTLPPYLVLMAILLCLGMLIATSFTQHLRKLLNGYNLEQYIAIYDRGIDILNMLEEGLLTINTTGRLTYINDFARALMDLPPNATDNGQNYYIQELVPNSPLMEVIETGESKYNTNFTFHGYHVLANQFPLYRDGEIVGALSVFRTAKLITELSEQLESANNMVDTLRAYNHEYQNNLHVILGYLEAGEIEEAKQFLLKGSMKSSLKISQISHLISHRGIAALIIGKLIRANECGISLTITPGSYCSEITKGVTTNAYITILGNLLENAIEELNSYETNEKEIQLTLYIDEKQTYISVLDTGRGMTPEYIETITNFGVSTKGSGRGTGLYLINNLITNLHGTLRFESEPDEGTEVIVMIKSYQSGGAS